MASEKTPGIQESVCEYLCGFVCVHTRMPVWIVVHVCLCVQVLSMHICVCVSTTIYIGQKVSRGPAVSELWCDVRCN